MQKPPQAFTLRPYQVETAGKGVAYLKDTAKGNGILVLPTGSGKSLIISEIVSRLNEPAIVFQPSKEILEQNLSKFHSYGLNPAVFSASLGKREIGEITLATIGSVMRHKEKFAHYRYILIDECHAVEAKEDDSMFMRFINSLNGPRILGLTATPYRLSTDSFGGSMLKFLTRTRPRVFTDVVHVVQNQELFDGGYLCQLEYKQVKTGFRSDRLRLNSTGADFTDASVMAHFKELNFSDQIVRCVIRLDELERGQSIIYTRFVEEAEYVKSQVPGCETLSAETPKREREYILEEFKAGRIQHISNVGVLVLGFDHPSLPNVILAGPTMSLARFYQMSGRAMRPHPSKTIAYVIDMVGLVEKFGRIQDLMLVDGGQGKWRVQTGNRHLTNVYYGVGGKRWHPNMHKRQMATR